MFLYLFNRIFSGILSLLFLTVFITFIILLSPVDPATLSFGQQMSEEMLDDKRKELMLDRSISAQVLSFVNDISPISFYLNNASKIQDSHAIRLINMEHRSMFLKLPYFRRSYQSDELVSSLIFKALPNTLILATLAILLATILGVSLGVISALREGTKLDGFIIAISTMGYSVPSYVSAIILSLLFGFLWKDWTGLNMQGSLITLNDIGDEVVEWKNVLLPALALGVRPVAVITQITRNSMLDIMEQPFITTAKAKGLKVASVVRRHVMKNIMNPIVTSVSGWFASLLAGAFFVESIFNYNGMGLLTVNALLNYDIPLLLGSIVVIASIFILINLLLDLIYRWIDPRVAL